MLSSSYRFRAEVFNLTTEYGRCSAMNADVPRRLQERWPDNDLFVVVVGVVVAVVVVVSVVVVADVLVPFPVAAPVQAFCFRKH